MLHYMQEVRRDNEKRFSSLAQPSPSGSMDTELIKWLSEQEQTKPHYSFAEIKAAMHFCQDSKLAAVLLQAGWTKQRFWSTRAQNLRVWIPPTLGA